jgi:putative FmdB family regulatory protein
VVPTGRGREDDDVPTYQYSCTECGHFFEQVQSFSDDALTTCPECAGRLRKVFNAVGVVFKGSGFYRTDSRTESRTESAAPAAKATADSGSSKESGAQGSSSKDSGSGSSTSGPSKGASAGSSGSGASTSTTSGSAA